MDEAYAALGGMDEFLGGEEFGTSHKVLIGGLVGFIAAVILVVIVYIVIKLFSGSSSSFSSYRQRRSRQGVAHKTQPVRFVDPMHSYPLSSENAFLDTYTTPMLEHDENRFSYDNVYMGMTGGMTVAMTSLKPYEENMRPNSNIPSVKNRYEGNNTSKQLANLLYQD
jgi:hypothetical protein